MARFLELRARPSFLPALTAYSTFPLAPPISCCIVSISLAHLRCSALRPSPPPTLADTSGIIVLKIIEYLAYKVQYADFASSDIREDFKDRIDPYIALELCVCYLPPFSKLTAG